MCRALLTYLCRGAFLHLCGASEKRAALNCGWWKRKREERGHPRRAGVWHGCFTEHQECTFFFFFLVRIKHEHEMNKHKQKEQIHVVCWTPAQQHLDSLQAQHRQKPAQLLDVIPELLPFAWRDLRLSHLQERQHILNPRPSPEMSLTVRLSQITRLNIIFFFFRAIVNVAFNNLWAFYL